MVDRVPGVRDLEDRICKAPRPRTRVRDTLGLSEVALLFSFNIFPPSFNMLLAYILAYLLYGYHKYDSVKCHVIGFDILSFILCH